MCRINFFLNDLKSVGSMVEPTNGHPIFFALNAQYGVIEFMISFIHVRISYNFVKVMSI